MNNNKPQNKLNTADIDEGEPPPSYQEITPTNHHYQSSSSNYYQYNNQTSQSIYPQVPSPLPQQQIRYQTIEIPYTIRVNEQIRQRHRIYESRRFPLAAIFFLFGWFCPPLWFIGACCCAGSGNEYESFWGKVNFIMAMTLIISSVIYSMIVFPQYIF
ncbi:uncharacterized protein BX663DRAFT_507077 [Cokeromyces recurvatus]|uniref:uncharacterized protein n=1 Tax=Cokeromyces recurvatus TaxID=90255 RepID=UPI00221F2AE8|nr:uncharacterized protein BX663DRAFT_507077 [Cokeromyces recurvatus]KAI7903609.1 hypothetical protein BX663DRAFT_507077 [Cokeromyces recurvatus]